MPEAWELLKPNVLISDERRKLCRQLPVDKKALDRGEATNSVGETSCWRRTNR
jgi:hypothetical protein